RQASRRSSSFSTSGLLDPDSATAAVFGTAESRASTSSPAFILTIYDNMVHYCRSFTYACKDDHGALLPVWQRPNRADRYGVGSQDHLRAVHGLRFAQ